MHTQRAYVPMGPAVGLRYEGVAARLEVEGLNDSEVWLGLQIIEEAWVEESLKKHRSEEDARKAREQGAGGEAPPQGGKTPPEWLVPPWRSQ